MCRNKLLTKTLIETIHSILQLLIIDLVLRRNISNAFSRKMYIFCDRWSLILLIDCRWNVFPNFWSPIWFLILKFLILHLIQSSFCIKTPLAFNMTSLFSNIIIWRYWNRFLILNPPLLALSVLITPRVKTCAEVRKCSSEDQIILKLHTYWFYIFPRRSEGG